MIPHAPSTSPTDSEIVVKFELVVEVQLMKFEKRSGEELHHDNKIAIIAPDDAFEEILIIFDDVVPDLFLIGGLCFNSTMFVTLGHR